ncbi:FolB domain-containing protein [Paracoccus gahaiensis]|uniref:dihydroneopterin aldolase n=1 Tax=Paracoccus gahaiensis TaxID=1706839 RepID=A0A4U0RFW7_9RHOB|nr:dihydroneopterin aldolase [Paracoccus gahaiensis]TJZ94077.1 FolB domain-containing protein [Paracoccus gahaiensis]
MEHPDRIFLRDHVLSAEIGAFQSERGRDQRLRFNLTVELRETVAGSDDHVDQILSYDVLTQGVTTALADQRYNLVETLAERIAAEVLAHPRAACIHVTVEKLDRGPGALGVSITRHRGRVPASGVAASVAILIHGPGAPAPQGAVVVLPGDAPVPAEGPHARRIALLALDQMAWALAGALDLEIAETRTELEAAIQAGQPVVWAPARLAADAPAAGETPDSLSLWLAGRIGAHRLDVARPEPLPLPALPEGLVLTLSRLPAR